MATPDTIFAKSYGDSITLLAQQQGSMILPKNAITVKRNVVGEETYMDQIDAIEMEQVTGRLQSINLANPSYARRRIAKYDFTKSVGLDSQDLLSTIPDPTNPVIQSLGFGAGRAIDDQILMALRGTAYTGKTGSTSQTLPSAQKVAHGSAGLTLTKLRSAKKILDEGKVPFQDRFLVLKADAMEDLLSDSTITSADFNTVKALVDGTLNQFLGFTFIQMECPTTANASSTLGSSTTFYALAFHKTGIGLAMWKDPVADISRRNDLQGFPKQLSYNMSIGASRLEEAKVVEIAYQ